MGKFELQKPMSQLHNVLKSQFFVCELYSNKLFQTIEKIAQFQQNHFCNVITSELYSVVSIWLLTLQGHKDVLPTTVSDLVFSHPCIH